MKKTEPIRYWNRESKSEEVEQVYGEWAVGALYSTRPGQALADRVLSGRWPSRLYGIYQASSLSRGKIRPFIDQFRIPMEEYEEREFESFNDFFIRRFRPGARAFESDPRKMPAFAEARYLAFERISPEQEFPVKGRWLSAGALLGDEELARGFEGGPMLLARLCPTDYHRFHYPDDGKVLGSRTLHGKLHSVNPLALRFKGEIFSTNERQISLLETANFGKLAYIEIGALCVGKIVQSHPGRAVFSRGDEKGYFLFGGSTVIVMGQPGKWRPDEDLLEQSSRRIETLVKLGQHVASAGG